MASGESEVESAAFDHDQGDAVAEVPEAVADLDGGLDPVVHGLEPCRSEEHTSELQSPMNTLFPYTTLFRSRI